jgi:2-dehydropantoate 2-reductase
MTKPLRIAVVGSGAIGLYYGGKLAAAGGDVHFLIRGDLDEFRRNGLRILGIDEDIRVPNGIATRPPRTWMSPISS